MTLLHRLEVEVAVLITGVIIIGAGLAVFSGYTPHLSKKIALPLIEITQEPTPSPKPGLPIAMSQVSPDGVKKLTMTAITNGNFTKTYKFVASNSDGTDVHLVYSLTLGHDTMAIPFNTWSPDDKYVFVTVSSKSDSEAVVVSADGTPVAPGIASLEATQIFKDRITDNMYDQTTGWASNTLLIINTKLTDGSKGPSYWFEVPSKAIIPLATEF